MQKNSQEAKKLAIIGAGIAGLSAGCYAAMNGFQVDIYEQGASAGGVCTAWRRGDYLFDGCLHWLLGSSPSGGVMRMIWDELGALEKKTIQDQEEFCRVVKSDGTELIVFSDIEKQEEYLLGLSPADSKKIKKFTALVRKFLNFDMPEQPFWAFSFRGAMKSGKKFLPYLPYLHYSKKSVQDYFSTWENPDIAFMFSKMIGEKASMLSLFVTLAWHSSKNAGWPEGGSLALTESILKRFLNLGGRIHYKNKVDQLLIQNNQIKGLVLEDGSQKKADITISAADGQFTLFHLLNGHYLTPVLEKMYRGYPLFTPLIQISFGVARDFSNEAIGKNYYFDKEINFGQTQASSFGLRHLCFDSAFAPQGKSSLIMMIDSPYEIWERLKNDTEAYQKEKKAVQEEAINQLEKLYPGIRNDIEVIDIATPLTLERYTGNWKASYEGWLPDADNPPPRIAKFLPGLNNFYMIGQWTNPGGGLITSAKDGRDIIYYICKQAKKTFKTSFPGQN